MKFNIRILYFSILLFLVVSTVSSSAKATTEILEWKVKVGDSMTYTISKYSDLEDSDGDGDPESTTLTIQNEAGEMVNVTYGKGTKYTTTITALNGLATTQVTYGSIVAKESTIGSVVMKTIDNRSYWEEYASTMSGSNSSFGSITVEGNNFVTKTNLNINSTTIESIVKTNWKTGWISYTYSKMSNGTHTISEMETTSGSSGITGLEVTSIFLGLFIIALLVSRKRK